MNPSASLLDHLAVCSWSLRPADATELVAMVKSLGLSRVQLALNDHRGSAGGKAIGAALREAGIEIVSGMFGTTGEDYTTLETIRRTGGLVPDETWEANQALVAEAVAAAAALDLDLVTFHAGFLPESPEDPGYAKLVDRLEVVAGRFAEAGIDLALETGQEEAGVLRRFLEHLEAPNLGVNFDPANMILYGKGEPVEALRILRPHLKQVHLKDAVATTEPGTWGSEAVIGTGDVDWAAFLAVLAETDYDGALCFEREANETRLEDIAAGKRHLAQIVGKGGAL